MKRVDLLRYIYRSMFLSVVALSGACTDGFREMNINPNLYPKTEVDNMFILVLNENIFTKGYFWSVANGQREGLQYTTPSSGATRSGGVGASAYWELYSTIATAEQIRRQLTTDDDKVRRAITYIPQIYNAIRVTFKYGEIPYSEAGLARFGGTLYPKFDTGPELLINLDSKLREVVDTIESAGSATKKGFADWADFFYKGDIKKWAKFANVLRLRIALVLAGDGTGVNVAKAKEICADVAASGSGIFESANDEYKFEVGKALDNPTDLPFGGGGELSGTPNKYLVDFLKRNQDPRLSMFIAPSALTDVGIRSLSEQLTDPKIDQTIKDNITKMFDRLDFSQTEVPVLTKGIPSWRYVGANPYVDQDKTGPDAVLYKTYQFVSYNGVMPSGQGGRYVFSMLNSRLHNPNLRNEQFFEEQNKNEANGSYVQPILTYSYMCLMLAQLDYLGIWPSPKGQDYAAWYNAGVEASIRLYDYIAVKHRANPYNWERSEAELAAAIQAYLTKSDVRLTGTGDWEKINLQQYLNCFHMVDLAADQVRITGIPAENSTIYPWAPRTEFVNRRSNIGRPSNENAERNWLISQNRQKFTPGVPTIRILHDERMWWDINSPDYGMGDILKTKK